MKRKGQKMIKVLLMGLARFLWAAITASRGTRVTATSKPPRTHGRHRGKFNPDGTVQRVQGRISATHAYDSVTHCMVLVRDQWPVTGTYRPHGAGLAVVSSTGRYTFAVPVAPVRVSNVV